MTTAAMSTILTLIVAVVVLANAIALATVFIAMPPVRAYPTGPPARHDDFVSYHHHSSNFTETMAAFARH